MSPRDRPQTQDTLTAASSSATSLTGAFLVVYHETDSQIRELQPGQPAVVGRSAHANVSVAAPSVSREHARFTLRDREVLVEDLGSRNGVILDGRRVERAPMLPGQHVRLGSVTVWFHQRRAEPEHGHGVLESYDELRRRVALELDRARAEHYCLGVLILRSVDTEQSLIRRMWLRIYERLGPVDAMTLYSPDAVLAILPAKSESEARRAVERLAAVDDRLLCGVAEYPRCAQSFEALVAEAHAAAMRATREGRVVFAEPAAAARAGSVQQLVVRSARLRDVLHQVDRLAAVDVPVLLLGESGTGKELMAQRLHSAGPRAQGPLCTVNCGALPAELVESALFGHVRGAFTGAERNAPGLFVQASSGTLLLDEVAELSPSAQVALLRVLETKLVRPIGGRREVRVEVRVVSATNADLEARVADGRFRADLLYRIAAVTVEVPPLRERLDDIEALAESFVATACGRWQRPAPQLAPSVRAALRAYAWPGNARELRNVLERALVIADATTLQLEHLPERVRAALAPSDSGGERAPTVLAPAPDSSADAVEAVVPPVGTAVTAYEESLIRQALHDAGGKRKLAAAQLGMPLRTFMRKLSKFGLVGTRRGR